VWRCRSSGATVHLMRPRNAEDQMSISPPCLYCMRRFGISWETKVELRHDEAAIKLHRTCLVGLSSQAVFMTPHVSRSTMNRPRSLMR